MPDFQNMTAEDFEAWKAENAPSFAGVRVDRDREDKLLREVQAKLPSPASPQDYDATEKQWLTGDTGYDFTLPSGKHCRMRDMPIEELAASGMLDRMTRLPGITQKLIDKSEGMPPSKEKETLKAISELLEVLNAVVPLIVVQPKVWPLPPEGEERRGDRVYPDSIELTDRVAIVEKAAAGVMKFDNFRG